MLSDRLTQLRKQKKLTIEEAASKMNMNSLSLHKFEKGSREPSLHNLCRIADFYSVSLDELVGRNWHPIFEELVYFTDEEIALMIRAINAKMVRLEKGIELDQHINLPFSLWYNELEGCKEVIKKLSQSKAIEG
ncbi:helix-turn-helix domain-containing protein [Hazenella coriacea]|uniref:Helix-turn-helix protein n=1 Tax=Hazenella coriacea TaxID=1179467 RepID=A0A4R3L1D4_9BACL|nr:helix-turn-helix transcriptional regulator [Hazenella coriacea]TCS93371.1 helix-turn-helix protein [Hazenella coriacea]